MIFRLSRSTTYKILATIAALGASASIAGMGTFATFTSTTTVSDTFGSGTVVIALGAVNTANNRLDVNATGLVPGDTIQRAVTLSNTGTQNLASIVLTTTATTSTALDTDAATGLQIVIDKCSQAWTEAGVAPAYTYTCGGSTSSVLATRSVIGSSIALSNLGSTTAGASDYLKVTLTLPSGAGNALQGLTSTVQFAFVGTQRTATNK